ncbi:MAG: hypothetical protein HXK07_01070 [Actinomyces sp.]|jgi:putative membrane protein|nr:hypothetical protein [Actinomyces sp.]
MFAAGIDSMVPAFAREGIWLFVFLFVVVLLRAQATYWLARGAASGAVLATGRQGFLGTMARWFDGPIPRKGAAMLDKWGIIVIPLCFLTVGIQTAVNAGAGLVRMRWSTYTIAMIPGCVLWALLYGLGTLAVFAAAIRAVAGSPWGWAGLTLIATLIAAKIAWGRRKRRAVDAALTADNA